MYHVQMITCKTHEILRCVVKLPIYPNMSEKASIDLAGVKQSRGVGLWLVKVPKYLSQQWDKALDNGEVGNLRIGKKEGKEELCFRLNEELCTLSSREVEVMKIPRDHPFTMPPVGGPSLAVYTTSETGEISMEGMIVKKAECKPAAQGYMKLKKLQLEESTKPQRLSQQLEKAVTNIYKPVANHIVNAEFEKKKRQEGRMVRAERRVVLDMLFSAFERHQYYNIKDLVDITKQPVTYLKEIMREIGVYNTKGLHKSTWELKPEYRHYQSTEVERDED
ncbi:general transcription factor IIF subunit 2-like isoform X1 [Gadus chalcogrammus]|uniref:General transcription factor IIF subunit 2 n=2 Tax=Gadus morhua TaxID=8049 RepID=A0A8C5F5N2_GADMO|nr:general transcription factor IIF subunit 2-like isoform X1 [Gadus chalcogrammus]